MDQKKQDRSKTKQKMYYNGTRQRQEKIQKWIRKKRDKNKTKQKID